jgi:DNA polymerase-1
MCRDQFVAEDGWELIEFDFSQLELRCMAMLSQDPAMLRIFREGQDFHRAAAALVHGKAPELVSKAERSAAKTVVFGLAYGKAEWSLARDLGVSVAEAAALIEAILGRFAELKRLIAGTIAEARRTGTAWSTYLGQRGRRRVLWDLGSADEGRRGHAERAAFNMLVQGTGSEIAMRANIEIWRWVREERLPVRLIQPVHDSALLEVRRDARDEVLWTVPRLMTRQPSAGVPLVVEASAGFAWGSMKGITLP